MNLVLASATPRRAELLSDAGMSFDVPPVHVDETPLAGESAGAMCRRLADGKARAASLHVGTPREPLIVIAADTTVEIEREILGKPTSRDDAREMLRRLSGKTHRVLTAISLIRLPDGATRNDLESTHVQFSPLSAGEIDEYAATGEPTDKAGGYAIQGRGGCFIERIDGCYFNVVGLPLARLYRNLREMGWTPSSE